MEVFRTEDGTVTKVIHQDGSETAIKRVASQSTFVNQESGEVETLFTDRHKYSVFISASLGCYLSCPFCHLTLKRSVYRPLSGPLANLQEAIESEVQRVPDLRERFVKLCWMGMGDALNQPSDVRSVSLALLDWIMEKRYAQGVDSVDLSTVMPKVRPLWLDEFAALNDELSRYPHNPSSAMLEQAQFATYRRYANRSSFRLFYSLHSARQTTRDRLAPNTLPLGQAITLLREFWQAGQRNIIFHQLFVQGLNDSLDEVLAIAEFMNTHFPMAELRVLRYNHCDHSPYKEWPEIDRALKLLAREVPHFKVQQSAGKEVQAACGQFLVAVPQAHPAGQPMQPSQAT